MNCCRQNGHHKVQRDDEWDESLTEVQESKSRFAWLDYHDGIYSHLWDTSMKEEKPDDVDDESGAPGIEAKVPDRGID